MAFKMANFDPLQFGLMEKEFFEREKTQIQAMIRQRCLEIETKLRSVENVLGFLDVMNEIDGTKTPHSEVKSNVDFVDI